MIIRVNTRANGDQLGDYISALKDNDHVEILEVDGREDADKEYLQQIVMSMELNAQLTKCKNPYLNIQINPAYGEDRKMSREDWYRAADILEEELNYTGQRRVITLHTKKGRTHAHVVWERYNHETSKVIPTKNSRLNAKFARVRIEKELGHKRTAWRNDKEQIKEELTRLWNATSNGAEFIKLARKSGYMVAAGSGNRPFMVVDQNGISCDLVRQLQGVRTKEVRARLRTENLIGEKRAIEIMREEGNKSGKREQQKAEFKPSAETTAKEFAQNRFDAITEQPAEQQKRQAETIFAAFKANTEDAAKEQAAPEMDDQTRKETIARKFADNDLSGDSKQNDREQKLKMIIEEQERQRQRRREHKRHR